MSYSIRAVKCHSYKQECFVARHVWFSLVLEWYFVTIELMGQYKLPLATGVRPTDVTDLIMTLWGMISFFNRAQMFI